MKNEEIAEYLRQAAELNGQLGEGHRQTSFDRGARIVDGLTDEQLAEGIKNDELKNFTGIGPKLSSVITAMQRDGDLEWLEEYKTALAKMDAEEDGAVVDPVVEKQAKKEPKKEETKAEPPAQQAMVKAETKQLAHKKENLSLAMLTEAYDAEKYNLLLPQQSTSEVPEGFVVSVTALQVMKSQTFPVDGGLALNRVALAQVANAAGIDWVAEERLDDQKDPMLCGYKVTGVVSDFDGRRRTVQGTKWIDLRKDAGNGTPGKDFAATKSEKQRTQMGKFIDGHAITKARNRAIRDVLGLKPNYQPHELAKPFVVPRLVLDASDPMAKMAMIAAAVGAQGAMFGGAQQALEAPQERKMLETPADPPPPEEDGKGEWE